MFSDAGSTPAASTSLRLSEAPSEDCRGEAIRRKRAIPMPAQILLRFSYDSEHHSLFNENASSTA